MLSHLTGIRAQVLESDRAKLETEVGVLLNTLVAHGQHFGPSPPEIKLVQITWIFQLEYRLSLDNWKYQKLIINPKRHV